MRRGREVQPPAPVRAALEDIFRCRIDQVRIIEHSWFVRLHGRAVATTRRDRIYLRGSAEELFANPWLMLHEYAHVLRQWRSGDLTVPRYLAECLRRGYWHNRFEVEARDFADMHLPRLSARLRESALQPSSASRR